MERVYYNGDFLPAESVQLPFPTIEKHGVFETIYCTNGDMPLLDFHWVRLLSSAAILGLPIPSTFTKEYLTETILLLCKYNHCEISARIKIVLKEQDDSSQFPDLFIQATAFDNHFFNLKKEPLHLGIYPFMKKKGMRYATLKSTDYSFYQAANSWAKAHSLDDAIIGNQLHHAMETSIANLFWIKDFHLFTPKLSTGCINGVFRSFLLHQLEKWEFECEEVNATIEEIESADEIFITNALRGIRSVKHFNGKNYSTEFTTELQQKLITPLRLLLKK